MLLNFKPRFVPFIADGSKTHTIRALRKHPPRVGETLAIESAIMERHRK